MAFAPTLWIFVVGRVVAGITGATYSTANAAIADITPPAERAKNFGMLGLAFGIGFIVGPLLGGLAGGFGTRAPFILASVLAALNFIYGFFFVPETLSSDKRRPFSIAHANPLASALRAVRHVEIRSFLAVLFLWQFAFQALPTTWSFFTSAVLQWNSPAIGVSLAYSGVMMALSQGVLVGPLVKKVGERNAALLGLSMGTVAYVCYALAHASWILYLGMTLWAFGSLVSPACNALMSQRIGVDHQGELQGLVGSTYGLSSIVAPLAMTQVFWRVGPSAPWISSPRCSRHVRFRSCSARAPLRVAYRLDALRSRDRACASRPTRLRSGYARFRARRADVARLLRLAHAGVITSNVRVCLVFAYVASAAADFRRHRDSGRSHGEGRRAYALHGVPYDRVAERAAHLFPAARVR